MEANQNAGSGVPLLSVRGIYKSFGLNAVLKGIDLDVMPGEVLALIGGNGAGKSTLMKIIMGIYSHDSGRLAMNGEAVALNRPSDALARGIYMVPQEPLLFPNMNVEENITIGFDRGKAELHKELADTMADIGWNLDLGRKASSLSIAEQQLVEILRGILRHARLLILDEPTSALTFDEVKSLFKVVRDLREKGIGIIYITHRLAEVFDIATHVAIMRDGAITIQGPAPEPESAEENGEDEGEGDPEGLAEEPERPAVTLNARRSGGEDQPALWFEGSDNVTASALLQDLLYDLRTMSMAKCVDYFPSEDAAEICGFQSADAILKVEYAANGAEQTFTLTVGARMPDESGRYVRLEEDGAIYALSTDSIDAVMTISVAGMRGTAQEAAPAENQGEGQE